MPSGTVSFLFTEIDGSPQPWERHPQGMQTALARHDALLAHARTVRAGQIVKRTGDGCHAVFAGAVLAT